MTAHPAQFVIRTRLGDLHVNSVVRLKSDSRRKWRIAKLGTTKIRVESGERFTGYSQVVSYDEIKSILS